MARKKAAETIEEEEFDGIHKDILNNYGDFVTSGVDMALEEPIIVPVSPAIDVGLNGGIPAGTWTIFNGPEKAGKTSTALKVAANAQKSERLRAVTKSGKVKVFYHDIEHRLKKMHVDACPDLDRENFFVVRSTKGQILSGEQQLDAIERCIKNEPGSVIIVDSFGALSTSTELTEDIEKQQRADSNKLVAKFVRRMAQAVPVNKIILIGITWVISNPSGYGGGKQEKTSAALQYQHDIKLKVKGVDDWIVQEKKIGQKTHWKIVTSALGGNGSEVTSFIRYGKGIDELAEYMHLGTELGLINQNGAWINFEFVRETLGNEAADQKFCGQEKASMFLAEQPEYQSLLRKCILDMLS